MRHRSTRPKREYAVVPNAAMRDDDLSIEARGMLALLMTYSDEWIFQRNHLMQVACVGRDRFQRIMRELIDAGYVSREAMREIDGRVSGSTWVINDAPDREPENPAVGDTEGLNNRQPGLPTAGFSGPIRRTTLKEDQNKEARARARKRKVALTAFEEFWSAHPRVGSREATECAFEEAVRDGVDPAVIVAAAKRYRAEKGHEPKRYLCASEDWVKQRRWQDACTLGPSCAQPKPRDAAELWARTLNEGGFIPPSAISCGLGREMIRRGLVTEAELRSAGVSL